MSRVVDPGIRHQMICEQKAALASNLSWIVRLYLPQSHKYLVKSISSDNDGAVSDVVLHAGVSNSWMAFHKSFYRWLVSQEPEFDVILLRYSMYDPFLYHYLRRVNKPVFLVHHTLEVPELILGRGLLAKLKVAGEMLISQYSLRLATGLIGVTSEILDYECNRHRSQCKNGYTYPNGFLCDQSILVDDERNDVPRFLFVASKFSPWQGLDCFLKSARLSEDAFHVDIVGDASISDQAHVRHDSRIQFHGHLSSESIRALAAQADISLSSFALFRKGMKEACTLKVRESLAMGLPVYAGHRDVFPAAFPYFKYGACDIHAMLAYSRDMRLISRQAVAEAAAPYIDKRVLLQSLYNWLSMITGLE